MNNSIKQVFDKATETLKTVQRPVDFFSTNFTKIIMFYYNVKKFPIGFDGFCMKFINFSKIL